MMAGKTSTQSRPLFGRAAVFAAKYLALLTFIVCGCGASLRAVRTSAPFARPARRLAPPRPRHMAMAPNTGNCVHRKNKPALRDMPRSAKLSEGQPRGIYLEQKIAFV